YSVFLAGTGQLKTAIAMREKLSSLEPLVPTFNASTVLTLAAAGDYAKALPMAQALPPSLSVRGLTLAKFYASMGRYNDAAGAALTVNPAIFPPEVIDEAVRLLRMAPASAAQQNVPYLGQFS